MRIRDVKITIPVHLAPAAVFFFKRTLLMLHGITTVPDLKCVQLNCPLIEWTIERSGNTSAKRIILKRLVRAKNGKDLGKMGGILGYVRLFASVGEVTGAFF